MIMLLENLGDEIVTKRLYFLYYLSIKLQNYTMLIFENQPHINEFWKSALDGVDFTKSALRMYWLLVWKISITIRAN